MKTGNPDQAEGAHGKRSRPHGTRGQAAITNQGFAQADELIAGQPELQGVVSRGNVSLSLAAALIFGSATGALIGGGMGALTGGVIGHAMDQQQRETLARENPQTLQRVEQQQPLGLADIKALTRAGISDEVIISQIRASRSVYRLSSAEIIDLKDSGVSEKVIDFMLNTPSMYAPEPGY